MGAIAIEFVASTARTVILDLVRDPSFAFSCGEVCQNLLAGGCPAASNFLLLRQKKVTKKGDPAVSVPALRYGQPAVLGPAGSDTNSLRSDKCQP